jgi:cytochrome c oxidase cbb3-type subunit 3
VSDFVNSGWAIFVTVATVISLVACLALLIVASRRRVMSSDNTTGHVWDEDLKEMNNPLPRWWMWLFVLTVVFSAVYLAFYPGLGTNPGTLKWTSLGQYEAEQAKARAQMATVYARFSDMPAQALAQDEQAMGIGQRLFLNNCAQCHGSQGRGSTGFPNLTDGDWLYGSDLDTIKTTITQGRNGVMPPLAAAVGSSTDLSNLSNYVLSLSASQHDAAAAALGKPKFAVCTACHGAEGKGNQALGAPNLTDKVWLHGWGEAAITRIVTHGKNNPMPAQNARLTPEQIHVLGAYVWQLSRPTTRVATGS